MNGKYINCSLCGHRYNMAENSACQACPLNPGCGLACCPACGFETIDPSQSALVRWLTAVREKLPGRRTNGRPGINLAFYLLEAPQGSQVLIQGFTSEVSVKLCERLQAYGLAPGVCATILQLSPVVILQVENLELALEPQLARQIQVSPAAG